MILPATLNGISGSAIKVESGWFEIDGKINVKKSKALSIGVEASCNYRIEIKACSMLTSDNKRGDIEGYMTIQPL
jgi:hypothetical protein